jgi:ERF superfamily
MKTSEQIIEIAQAMNHVQRQMKPAIKDSTNPHFKSKYSDLSSVMEAIREPLGSQGLSIWQDATLDEQGVNITTRIVHISGQWVEFGPLTIPLGKKDAHAVGSACSYGKRYALCAALGVVSDDDDGNQAVASQEKKKEQPKMIEKQQCIELNTLIEQCDATYQTNLWAYLNSQQISSFAEMNEKTFLKLKKGCLNNISQKREYATC